MAALGLTLTAEEFTSQIVDAGAKMRRAAHNVIQKEAELAGARMRKRFVRYPGASGGLLNRRSGGLQRSIGIEVKGDPSKDKMRFAVGVLPEEKKLQQQAHTQEFGDTIRTKGVKPEKLAIPVAAGLDSRGVRRFETIWDADRVYSMVKFTEDHIFGIRGDKQDLIAVRKDEVTIPPRPFVGPEGDAAKVKIQQRIDSGEVEGVI